MCFGLQLWQSHSFTLTEAAEEFLFGSRKCQGREVWDAIAFAIAKAIALILHCIIDIFPELLNLACINHPTQTVRQIHATVNQQTRSHNPYQKAQYETHKSPQCFGLKTF
jgi:hypothetical protein